MLRKLLLIFVLICVTTCEQSSSYSVENLYTLIDQTAEYFKSLNNAYKESKIDVISDINNAITKYMENATKTISQRRKRSLQNELQSNNGINVLENFEELISIDLSDFQDVFFFSGQDEDRSLWFAAAINSSGIFLYQLVDNKLQIVGIYPQFNGKRIIVNTYGTDILMVVQKYTDEIIILRTSKGKNGEYEFHFKQEFEIPGVIHMNMWLGMNQLYLGIASNEKIFIYVWLGEHFDKIDILYFRARKLLPYQHKSFMHIVAVGTVTKIFRFSVRFNKFIETQNLHGTRDASTFYFKEGHFEEHFLVLAGDNSTILYKEMYDRFVPFQNFAATDHIYSVMMENIIILLFLEQNTATIYQYNGWRFVKLHTKLSNIRQIQQIRSYGEDTLIVENQDREWKLLKPVWTIKKTWQTLQSEIEAWCFRAKQNASQRKSVEIPDLKDPVKILNAYIGQLRVRNINGHNAKELIRLTEQYKKTIAKLNLVNNTLAQALIAEKPKRTILHGKKIAIQCRNKCHVRHINTDAKTKPVKFKRFDPINQTLHFNSLKVKNINNWKCPIPNFDIEDIVVKKSINEILMQNLQKETLKISGEQILSGEHIFLNLHATNISMPLNIATHNSTQIIQIKEAKVKELHLMEDEFFLPLNASTATIMTGSITAAEVRVTGLVNLKGRIEGEASEKLSPQKEISTPLTLSKDLFLQNVRFRGLIKTKDIVRTHGLSLKEILENSIPLDSNIPGHLILSSDKIQWHNMTLYNYKDWITKNSTDIVVISGAKSASNNIILTNATYATLSTPKLTVPLCAAEIITPEIRTSSIAMDSLIVKNLNVSHMFGAYNLNNTVFGAVSALQNVDFSTKLFEGSVIKNISISNIKGMNLTELKMNKWIDINWLKGPVNATKLLVDNVEPPIVFNFSLPTRIKNIIVKADTDIGKINDVNISSFAENVLKVDNMIFLEQVVFADGFKSNHVHASRSTLNLSHLDAHTNLYSKRISKTLKTNMINIPENFDYPASDIPSTFIIQGSVSFLTEPTVQNIQNITVKELCEDIWMLNNDSVVSGNNINIKNMTIEGDIMMYKDHRNSLNVEEWFNLSNRLLSKTKQQNITTVSSFKDVEVPAVIATNNSVLNYSDSDLEDLLMNSLMKNKMQTVTAIWHFEELIIDALHLNNKINDIDLNTDIVRYDAKQNIITGKKTITSLTTKNLWSYDNHFSNWTNGALIPKGRKLPIIKGRKTFNNITLNNLSVKGKIMGHNIQEALLKSGNQIIYGIKKIQGRINAPSLIVDSTVNDINLTHLMDNQIKKHKAVQTIESETDFRNNLDIFGNVTINGFYEGIDLTNINNSQNRLNTVLKNTKKIMESAEDITIALQNHAVYLNKFEVIDENALKYTLDSEAENVIVLNNTCLCEPKNISLLCNDTKLLSIVAGTNSSTFIMMKLVLLDDAVFVVIAASDYVSIYSYSATEQQLYQKAGLYMPNILQASVEPADNSLWIILQLPEEMLILHYEVWNELKQYTLPGSDIFLTSMTPNNQLLLLRSDGVWNLEGVFHPEHIFKLPLNGKIKAFALDTNYYIRLTTKNSTTILKAQYIYN